MATQQELRFPTLLERARDYVAFSALPGSVVFGICNFWAPQDKALVLGAIAALGFMVAAILLGLVVYSRRSGRVWNSLERLVRIPQGHYAVWNRQHPLRSHGVHLVALFALMCALLAQQSQISVKPMAPAEALRQLGYDTTPDGLCRALASTDDRVVQLLAVLQPKFNLGNPVGEGQYTLCIEEALVEGAPLKGLLPDSGLAFNAKDLNRRYASRAVGMENPGKLDIAAVVRTSGRKLNHVKLMEVQATPLMYAVWGGDAGVVKSLVERGADPSLPSRMMVVSQKSPTALKDLLYVYASPLSEARRLKLQEVVQVLESAQAKAQVRIENYM